MPPLHHCWVLLPLLVGCIPEPAPPAPGTNISGLKDPHLPSDFRTIDYADAIAQALNAGASATLSTVWGGHHASIEGAPYGCPHMYLGAPPALDEDADEDNPGFSWDASCTTDAGVSYAGFQFWTTEVDTEAGTGSRTLMGEATVTDGSALLYEFDGEAADEVSYPSEGGWSYSTEVDGEVFGTLPFGGATGLRATQLTAGWGSDGTIDMVGQLHVFDGYGPTDTRTLATIEQTGDYVPEGWVPGLPRFTSARFDLEFTADCPQEPVGYIGLRGNGGIWFDIYFLPRFNPEDDSAQSNAYPYDIIVNEECDGVGTIFVRNIAPEEEPWDEFVTPDFAVVAAQLDAPPLTDFVYTLRNFPVAP